MSATHFRACCCNQGIVPSGVFYYIDQSALPVCRQLYKGVVYHINKPAGYDTQAVYYPPVVDSAGNVYACLYQSEYDYTLAQRIAKRYYVKLPTSKFGTTPCEWDTPEALPLHGYWYTPSSWNQSSMMAFGVDSLAPFTITHLTKWLSSANNDNANREMKLHTKATGVWTSHDMTFPTTSAPGCITDGEWMPKKTVRTQELLGGGRRLTRTITQTIDFSTYNMTQPAEYWDLFINVRVAVQAVERYEVWDSMISHWKLESEVVVSTDMTDFILHYWGKGSTFYSEIMPGTQQTFHYDGDVPSPTPSYYANISGFIRTSDNRLFCTVYYDLESSGRTYLTQFDQYIKEGTVWSIVESNQENRLIQSIEIPNGDIYSRAAHTQIAGGVPTTVYDLLKWNPVTRVWDAATLPGYTPSAAQLQFTKSGDWQTAIAYPEYVSYLYQDALRVDVTTATGTTHIYPNSPQDDTNPDQPWYPANNSLFRFVSRCK